MAHRGRSKTAESNDAKKSRGTPRRLTEKIANMKKREHEQSEAFEQAMKSIFEMQRARIHSGGGSMPSLQAIDSTPPGPSIDMQLIFQDFNEVQRQGGSTPYSASKERPHSSGPAGRRVAMARANSVETDPYPVMGRDHNDPGHYWNASPEWIDGDLSRHKSDSDLQQSLLIQQQASPQHASPLLGSPQTPRNHKIASSGDLGLWASKRRPNSMTHALLSPDQYTGTPDAPVPSPLGMSSGGAASSLPDLTNIEFSCGLDIPLERDDPINEPQPPPPPQQQQQIHIPSIGQPFHSPPGSGPGPSKLIYSSFQIPPSPPTQQPFLSSFPPPYPSNIPVSSFGVQNPSPLAVQTIGGGIQRSTTMPDFRNLNSSAPAASCAHAFGRPIHPHQNPTPQFRPILPSMPRPTRLPPYRPPPGSLPTFVPQIHTPPHGMRPPPMTIIIQPPPNTSTVNSIANNSAEKHFQQQNSSHQHNNYNSQQQQTQQHHQQQQVHSPLQTMSPQSNGVSISNVGTPPASSQPAMPPTPGSIHSLLPSTLPGSPHKPSSVASLPSTPVLTFSPGLPVLPSYFEAKQQQALQLKFASINVGKNEALVRSHSEENLQKAQKDKGDVIQHNPFMGTLANANSVPCVYVEPSNTDFDYPIDGSESPTPGDSPSTSASYASSPPSVRPFWMEHPQDFNEFMFNKWPLEGANSSTGSYGGGGVGIRTGSPPIHHRSLSDLNAIPPELVDLSPTGRNKSLLLNHQLSLPSIAMTDLTMDEHLDKAQNLNSPSDFYLPPDADFEMEDAVMDSLLKSEVPDLQSFEAQLLVTEANMLASEAFMSSSPESYLHSKGEF